MGHTKNPPTNNIDLFFMNEDDLDELLVNNTFKKSIIIESYKSILKALRRKAISATVITINNLEISINVDKENFKPILEKALVYFEKEEDYKECSKITKIIKKLS